MISRLLLVLSATAAMASSSGFLLGVNYSEWFPSNVSQIATDSAGALYILTSGSSSSVTKLSADGKSILWQNQLGFTVTAMAVDPSGGVYVLPATSQSDTSVYVAKLAASGTGLAWKTSAGFLPIAVPVLTADSQGRTYVAAQYITNNYITQTADVVRLNAAGTTIDYTAKIMGIPTSVAVDPSGAAFISGTETNGQGVDTGFLARVAPDGSNGFYSVLPLGTSQTVAVDANGNVALFGAGRVQHIDSSGGVTVSSNVGGVQFALDSAGNAYVTSAPNQLYAVKNSIAGCGFDPRGTPPGYSQTLAVIAADGSELQSTYIPGANNLGSPLVATGPNSTVFVVAVAGPSFAPTQAGPFPVGSSRSFLTSLAPNAGARTYQLVCIGSSASLAVGPIAPGELVTLFGNALGPAQGIETQATFETPYPNQAANVSVTFDGFAAPLLWVQDAQINVVVPWELTPGQNTQVCVSYNGVNTNCLSWPLVEAVPAVFTVDGTYAAALNQDGTVNTAANPAPVGSIVTVFATGLGPLIPPQPDGSLLGSMPGPPLPANALPLGVQASYSIGIPFGTPENTVFDVQYAGPAVGMVAGISKISFQVEAFPSYGAIYLTTGSVTSPGFEVHIAGQ